MRTIAVTGSASGIGAALRQRLENEGDRVIGIDIRDAEVVVDLGHPAGRAAAVEQVVLASGGTLDGLVACAGVGPQIEPTATIVSINYFGAMELLAALRPLLQNGTAPAAVAVSSNSATIVPGADGELCDACLASDESEARRLADAANGSLVYASSKLALARWVRQQAVTGDWAGSGIRLNAIAPGAVQTPLLQAGLDHPLYGMAIRSFPIPLGSFGGSDQIAAAIRFLLSEEAGFCCGSVLFVDGGSDALVRSQRF